MKRFLTLLLAAAMVLSFAACGDNGTTIRNENEKDNVKKDPIAAQYLQDLAVKTADYPVLPAMPNESELTRHSAPSTMTRWARMPMKGAGEDLGGLGRAQQCLLRCAQGAAQQGHELPRGIPALHAGDGHAAFGGEEHRSLARKPVSRLCDAQRDDGRRQPRAAFVALGP